MNAGRYKFEKFNDRNFPVYVSRQSNRRILAEPCFHEEMEFLIIRTGVVSVQIGEETFVCAAPAMVIIAPFILHGAVSFSDDASVDGVVFQPSILGEYKSFSMGRLKYVLMDDRYPEFRKIENVINRLICVYFEQGISYKLEITAYLLLAVSVLLQQGSFQLLDPNSAVPRIQAALDYIAQNYQNDIQLTELSKCVCVCENHLIRLFKQATSKTPIEYVIDYRIAQGMKLLASDTLTITQISDRLHFSNCSHFGKLFRKKIGMTPSEYRKKYSMLSHQ